MLTKSVWFIWLTCFVLPSVAKRSLSATSLVSCMENSQLTPTYFDVVFNPDDRSVTYNLDLTSEISDYVLAYIEVYAYGFRIINKTLNLCDQGWKQFCPLYPESMQIQGIEYISKTYVDELPGITYQVPDIDAVLRVVVEDYNGTQLACIQSSFSNGKTVNHVGVKWATAVIAGIGLLFSTVLSTFGNSNAASHVSANAVSLFLYFQSVVVISMLHVELMPPIAAAWAENLAWSMGLIRVNFMQEAVRWYVQATGGHPTTYLKGSTRQVLVQRSLSILDDLYQKTFKRTYVDQIAKRSTAYVLESNASLLIYRGIKRLAYKANIEETNIVVTGYVFFLFCGFILAVILVSFFSFLTLGVKWGKINPSRVHTLKSNFHILLKGSVARYCYIGFTQLTILSLWEFTQRDSPAVIVFACLFLIFTLTVMYYSLFRVYLFGKESIETYNNPAALLYGNAHILNKYGFCYTMFTAQKYWFGIVLVTYNLIKGFFVALSQASGKTQALAIFILDLFFTIYLIRTKPYLDKSTNVINYLISIVTTINSFLFMFFSKLFNQKDAVGSIMGWVFFILNAAFSLILLILIIFLCVSALISKNPDSRFAPAKDDRTSFQRTIVKNENGSTENKTGGAPELMALGAAAQLHQNDWENEIYKLNNISDPETSRKITDSPIAPSQVHDNELNEKDGIDGIDGIDETQFEAITSNNEPFIKSDEPISPVKETLSSKLKNRFLKGKSFNGLPFGNKNPSSTASTNLFSNAAKEENISNYSSELDHENNTPGFQFIPASANKQTTFPADDPRSPINHNRQLSAMSGLSSAGFSAYSTNPVNDPVTVNDFVFSPSGKK